jgi:hypothetical protein
MTYSGTTCAAMAAVLAVLSGTAVGQSSVQSGVLECRGSGATGWIIGSVHELECIYRSDYGPMQRYHGVVRKLGLDIGITEQSSLAWAVFAPTNQIGPGDLAGEYAGVAAAAAIGVGAGANALVGGSNNTFALQPVSFEGQAGVNIAVGVASLELRYGP